MEICAGEPLHAHTAEKSLLTSESAQGATQPSHRRFGQDGHQRLVAGAVAFAEVVQGRFDHVGAEIRWIRCRVQFPEEHSSQVIGTGQVNIRLTSVSPSYPTKRLRSPSGPLPSGPLPSYSVISSSTTISAKLLWIRLSISCRHR